MGRISLREAFDVYQLDDSDILLFRFYSTGYIIVKDLHASEGEHIKNIKQRKDIKALCPYWSSFSR